MFEVWLMTGDGPKLRGTYAEYDQSRDPTRLRVRRQLWRPRSRPSADPDQVHAARRWAVNEEHDDGT
jgi:hypothetical protein